MHTRNFESRSELRLRGRARSPLVRQLLEAASGSGLVEFCIEFDLLAGISGFETSHVTKTLN